MPNYIKNRLTIIGSAKDVLAFIKGEGTVFDFNKIMPMPKELDIEASSLGDDGMNWLCLNASSSFAAELEAKELENKMKERNYFESAIELGKKYLYNIAKHGQKNWYGWCTKNWGTKWNALEPCIISENCIEFETAWAGVVTLMEKLSAKFPGSFFEYKYADEDIGCNCGYGTIKNGASVMIYPENISREAYDLAFELRPDYKENYLFKDGNYISKEE